MATAAAAAAFLAAILTAVMTVHSQPLAQTSGLGPGINFVNDGCSPFNVTDSVNFNSNLNATFAAIAARAAAGEKFVTAERRTGTDPVSVMLQCRDYMSATDCAACFRAASQQIRNCSAAAIGARIVFDGCFLRYERSDFYRETTRDANREFCTNRITSSPASNFNATIQGLLSDLLIATPKTPDLYAAGRRQVSPSANSTVYAFAQCVRTIDEIGCRDCLEVAVRNIQRCPPNGDGRAVDSGCFMRYSDSRFFADNQTTDLEPFLSKGISKSKAALIGGLAGGISALFLVAALFFWFYFSKRSKKTPPKGDILGATELRGATMYNYKDLKSATGNFSPENKLGEGGFGDVYKGTLKNGKIVAVKKLIIGQNPRARTDFESEVTLISNVHHRNLIRLLGCCTKGLDQLLLVYEYMPNSSLDRFLFPRSNPVLSWKQRFDVILGTAQGLAYLHEQFHVCIIHRDIKPGNILLDDDFMPKIADFGLARLMPEDQTHLSTKFAGTLGYTAPEYAIHGQLSEKVDTYSYGVVVLEIISGTKNSGMIVDSSGEFLLKRAWNLYERGAHIELVDEAIDPTEYQTDEMNKIIEIALTCTQSTPAQRPTMSEVVVILKSLNKSISGGGGSSNELATPVTRPAFIDNVGDFRPRITRQHVGTNNSGSTTSSSSASHASASITQLSGR
ncbi:Cysteine-rich receptor-like protein kinase 42 [Linum perenne]